MTAPDPIPQLTYDQFLSIDIRVGTIVTAEPFPQALKPAVKLTIDFGPRIGVKASSAQITVRYAPETLVVRQVAAVVNLPPRQIGPFLSEVLVLGFADADGAIVLVAPDKPVPEAAGSTDAEPATIWPHASGQEPGSVRTSGSIFRRV